MENNQKNKNVTFIYFMGTKKISPPLSSQKRLKIGGGTRSFSQNGIMISE